MIAIIIAIVLWYIVYCALLVLAGIGIGTIVSGTGKQFYCNTIANVVLQ
jgi:hypothetical protein